MNLIIRRAIEPDSTALSSLAEQTFRDTFFSESIRSDMELHCKKNFCPDIQRREILDSNTVTILAEIDRQLVGFAQIRLVSPMDCIVAKRPSELYRLYVSNKWQGSGVAHELMSEVFTTAATAQGDCIWLGVWEHNPRAISFYSKHDFKIAGEHLFQLGNDPQRDLVMVAQV